MRSRHPVRVDGGTYQASPVRPYRMGHAIRRTVTIRTVSMSPVPVTGGVSTVDGPLWGEEPMHSRITPPVMVAFLGALIMAVNILALTACTPPVMPTPASQLIDVTKVAPCPAEDGPGMTGPAPCVFDGGANGSSAYGVRWIYYSKDTCPVDTVQGARFVRCISREDWTGGVGSGEGRRN